MKSGATKLISRIAIVWVWAFVLFAIALPLFAVFFRVIQSPQPLVLLFEPDVLGIVRITAFQAVTSTFISVCLGVAMGLYIGSRSSKWGVWGRLSELLLTLPYAVPTVVVGFAGVAWLGRSGYLAAWGLKLDWLYSLKAVILAHVFLNAPLIALLVAQARAQVPKPELESARTLGTGRWGRFYVVVFPYVKWAIASGSAQVFSLCAMSFALVLLLGGGPPVETLETAIYARVRYSMLDISSAAACALWQMALTILPWLLIVYAERRQLRNVPADSPDVKRERMSGGICRSWFTFGSFGILACAVPVMPYLVLFSSRSLAALDHPEVFLQVLEAMRLSLALAAIVSVLTILTAVAGVVAVGRRGSEILNLGLALPSGISVLVLGLGVWLAYGRWLDPFEGSFMAMALVQVVLFVPVGFRMLWPVALGRQSRLLEAAGSLGASSWQAFWAVEWPRWRRPLVSALALVAGASIGEVAAVSLFYSEKLIPLPILVTRWMTQYRFEEAQLVAMLLFVLSAGTVAFVSFLGIFYFHGKAFCRNAGR